MGGWSVSQTPGPTADRFLAVRILKPELLLSRPNMHLCIPSLPKLGRKGPGQKMGLVTRPYNC